MNWCSSPTNGALKRAPFPEALGEVISRLGLGERTHNPDLALKEQTMKSQYLNRALTSSAPSAGSSLNLGTVSKWFVDRKFGFIRPDNAAADVYAHLDAVVIGPSVQQLRAGQRIAFTIGISERTGRPEAQSIHLAN